MLKTYVNLQKTSRLHLNRIKRLISVITAIQRNFHSTKYPLSLQNTYHGLYFCVDATISLSEPCSSCFCFYINVPTHTQTWTYIFHTNTTESCNSRHQYNDKQIFNVNILMYATEKFSSFEIHCVQRLTHCRSGKSFSSVRRHTRVFEHGKVAH